MKSQMLNLSRYAGMVAFVLTGVANSRAADPIWYNQSIYSGPPPQIDATIFVNEGALDFFIQTPATAAFQPYPFETLNTLYYTNRGTLFSSIGVRFDNHGDDMMRRQANSFYNGGELVSEDSVSFQNVNGTTIPSGNARSLLDISATNIVNRGLLETGEAGQILLSGKSVNLSRSGVRVAVSARTELPADVYSDFEYNGGTNYINAPGITDFYWSYATNVINLAQGGLNGQPIYGLPDYSTPLHSVQTNFSGGSLTVRLPGPRVTTAGSAEYAWATPPLANYQAFAFENSISGTNFINQAVFIPTYMRDGQITAEVGFARLDPGSTTNVLSIAAGVPTIRIDVGLIDPIFGRLSNPIYITDFSLIRSNFLSTNGVQQSARPRTLRISRAPDQWWSNRFQPNANYNQEIHAWSGFYSNSVVLAAQSAYSVNFNEGSATLISNLFSQALPESTLISTNPYAPLALFDPTNRSGRVELKSEGTLDLRRTKLYSHNFLKISAQHVEHDDLTVLDAPFMSLDFSSTNGLIEVDNLVPDTVERLEGKLFMHSMVWSNSITLGTNLFPSLHHFLFVDPEDLVSVKDVIIFEANLKADNIVIRDRVRTTRKLLLDATNLVLYGDLQPTLDSKNVGAANMPRLLVFTNYSTNSLIQGRSEFGVTPAPRLMTWSNPGRWLGFSHRILSANVENSGEIIASRGNIELDGDTIDVRGGLVSSQLDTRIKAQQFLAAGSAISAGGFLTYTQFTIAVPGALVLDISNELDDGGPSQNNLWNVSGGFHLVRKPLTGDLLGTRIRSSAENFREVIHSWAGEDRGPSVAGYANNAALRQLTLEGSADNLFVFGPATANNALYVELLEFLGGVADVANTLEILPGMKIYFGASNLNPLTLESLFPGQLIYLPNSAATLIQLSLGGQEHVFRADFVSSSTIDSDGDGTVNGLDEHPFGGVKIFVEETVTGQGVAKVIWWQAAARTQYKLQHRGAADSGEWSDLKTVYSGPDGGVVGALDTLAAEGSRFYRVIYTP